MSCLGERLTALVDGELGHDERDRALAHVAVCARCRAEAATLRSLKGRLRGLGGAPAAGAAFPGAAETEATDPLGMNPVGANPGFTAADADDLPTGDFLSRLHDIGRAAGSAEPPPPGFPPGAPGEAAGRPVRPLRSSTRPARPPRRVRSGRTAAFARPRDTRPAGHAAVLARPRRRYLVVGAATLVLGLGTASYAAGGRQEGPAVTPEFDRFAVEHAMTSGDAPVTEPLVEPVGGARSPQPNRSIPVSAGP